MPPTNHSLADSAVISAAITGSAGLEQNSTATTTLSGANSYGGASIINQGTLAIGSTQNLPGGVTFGAAPLSTTLGSLNMATASATFGGVLLVQTNSTTANTITIGTGQILNLTAGLTQGSNNAAAATHSNLTISGAGALSISGAALQIGVSQTVVNASNSSSATLDLSGLTGNGQANAFTANVTSFNVGEGNDDQGTVILSNSGNVITTATLNVGNSTGNNAAGATNVLTLGTGANVINADTINIAFSKTAGTISWASSSPGAGTLLVENREESGGANITISSNNGTGTGADDIGLLDLRGHNSTVIANVLSLGTASNAEVSTTSGATGTLDFDTGTLTANSVIVGSKSLTGGTGLGAGIINLSGGAFTVNVGGSVVLATNTATTGTATGLLDITGGVFTSNADITEGGGTGTTGTITLAGGTLNMTGHNIGGATAINVLNFQTGVLENVAAINVTAGIAKSTTGTLTLAGVDTFVGATQITAGTIVASGSISGTSSVSVGSGGTTATALTVTGSVLTPGAVTVGNAATLSGNGVISAASLTASSTSAANPAIVAPTSGNAAGLTINNGSVTLSTNATLQLSIANSNAGSSGAPAMSDYSKLTLGTGVSANVAGSDIAVTAGSVNRGDLFTIILSGTAVTGTFANTTPVTGSPGIYAFSSNGQNYEINYAYSGPATASGITQAAFQADTGGTNVALLMIPEPNSWSMLLGSLGIALGLQRFRRQRK